MYNYVLDRIYNYDPNIPDIKYIPIDQNLIPVKPKGSKVYFGYDGNNQLIITSVVKYWEDYDPGKILIPGNVVLAFDLNKDDCDFTVYHHSQIVELGVSKDTIIDYYNYKYSVSLITVTELYNKIFSKISVSISAEKAPVIKQYIQDNYNKTITLDDEYFEYVENKNKFEQYIVFMSEHLKDPFICSVIEHDNLTGVDTEYGVAVTDYNAVYYKVK